MIDFENRNNTATPEEGSEAAPRSQRGDGFFRVAACTPEIRVADCRENAARVLEAMANCAADGAGAAVFPELCLTGYTCGDLFHDVALLRAAEDGLAFLLAHSEPLPLLAVIGVPVAVGAAVYNCAAVCCQGRLLGLTAKNCLPNYGEFYEERWFTAAPPQPLQVSFAGQRCLLGSGLLYACTELPELKVGVEVCEDLWVPQPPSVSLAQAGATLLLNPSASDEVVGKAGYRRELLRGQSARLYCAYAYADAGRGESTTDMVFSGHNLVAENGAILAEARPFGKGLAAADVDLQRLEQERRRASTWRDGPAAPTICFSLPYSFDPDKMTRTFPRRPFVPASVADLDERCELILAMQAEGLRTRLKHTGLEQAVVGVSGGLDSTLALLVTVRAFDLLRLPRGGITAVSMPGFGTTPRTKNNAAELAQALGVSYQEIPIGAAVLQHFADIGHNVEERDVTYENSQARERTQVLMDLANQQAGLVIGTGDLSELALGWATYNGDQMSMYAVNASVPKTLVRHLIKYSAGCVDFGLRRVLEDVLDTPVSPELLPPENGHISQRTEELVGPYELHDFFLYYMLRFGFAPGKIYRMARRSFSGLFTPHTIRKWLRVFYQRFFAQQFKRSCMPDSPKVGTVTLSPRGDWRMPSDASARLWLEEIEELGA